MSQIGATYISDEQGISGENGKFLTGFILQQIGGALRCMAWRVQYFERDLAQGQHFPVFGLVNVKSSIGRRTIHDGCTRFFGQINVAGNEVSVKVGLKNVFELGAIFSQFFEVRLGFAQGVDDDRLSFTFDIICCLSQAAGIDLLYFHAVITLEMIRKYESSFIFPRTT